MEKYCNIQIIDAAYCPAVWRSRWSPNGKYKDAFFLSAFQIRNFFFENSRTLHLCIVLPSTGWLISYRIVEGVTLSDSRRSFDRFALKSLHYIIRCWATFIRFYYWTTSRPISNILHIKAITELRHFHILLTERRELTPAVTIALVNKHHALSGEFI